MAMRVVLTRTRLIWLKMNVIKIFLYERTRPCGLIMLRYNVFSELSTFLQTMLSEEWVFMLSIFFSSFLLFLTGKVEKQRKIIIVIGFETF